MRTTRRERAWTASRALELIYTFVFTALFIIGYWQRPSAAWVYWGFAAAATLLGFWIWIRQYRALDELGQLRFLKSWTVAYDKSWTVAGMVTSTGLATLIGWAVLNTEQSAELPTNMPFFAAYAVLLLGLLAMALTNWVLNRGDSRHGGQGHE